jgi:hypothetical protein
MPHSPQRLYTAAKSGLPCLTPREHSTTGTISLTLSGWLGPSQHCSAAANWQRGRHAERWRPRQALPNPRQLPQHAARCTNHSAKAYAVQSGLVSSCKTLGTTAACSPTWRPLMSPAGWNVPTVTSTRGPHSILANTPLQACPPPLLSRHQPPASPSRRCAPARFCCCWRCRPGCWPAPPEARPQRPMWPAPLRMGAAV